MINFVLEMTDCILKMMNFPLKMMKFSSGREEERRIGCEEED